MSTIETYSVRMGCDNCGHDDTYHIPVRQIIANYFQDEEEVIYSHHHRKDSDQKTYILCHHCKLPHLQVFWWKELDNAPINSGVRNG